MNERAIATILAALQYWQEEMCPHGPATMQFYLPPEQSAPLAKEEIDQLRQDLANWVVRRIRYVLCDPTGSTLQDIRTFPTADQAAAAARNTDAVIAALLLS